MNRGGSGLTYFALVLSGLALLVSLGVYGFRARAEPVAAPPSAPVKVSLSMVVATFSGQGVFAHRWYPTMMVVREDDTVDLAVANPDEFSHQFQLIAPDQNALQSKVLTPGTSDRLTFVADQVGVYMYQCMLPHDPAKRHCTPDHDQMRGYLIVTAR